MEITGDLALLVPAVRESEHCVTGSQSSARQWQEVWDATADELAGLVRALGTELSGFEARRAKSAEIIARVKAKGEVEAKLAKTSTEELAAREQVRTAAQNITQLDYDLEAFGPVRIENNRVTIHPVEWVQAPNR